MYTMDNIDENGNGKESHENGVERPGMGKSRLSVVSSVYDRQGKGYLTETEREMRRMDSKNMGYLDIDKIHHVVEEKLKLEKSNHQYRITFIALAISIVILAVANLGTAYLAVALSKETQVQEDGTMTSKSSTQDTVKTRGMGYSFESQRQEGYIGNSSEPTEYYCTTTEELAALWTEVVDEASSVNFVSSMKNEGGKSDNPILSSTRLLADAYTTETAVCFPTDGNKTLCADFYKVDENLCRQQQLEAEEDAGGGRRLEEISRLSHDMFYHLIGRGRSSAEGGVASNRHRLLGGKQKSDPGYSQPLTLFPV